MARRRQHDLIQFRCLAALIYNGISEYVTVGETAGYPHRIESAMFGFARCGALDGREVSNQMEVARLCNQSGVASVSNSRSPLMHDENFPWEDVLAQVRQGSESAAHRLVEWVYPSIIRIVRAHLGNRSDEEDAMQDIFLKMFTKMEQYRGGQPFVHWVGRIAVNTCHDRYRAKKARPVSNFSDLCVEDAGFLDVLMANHMDMAQEQPELTTDILEKLIAGLNDREQLIIRLLDLEQRSVREIADLTGWGDSKIKVTALRARKKLASLLKELEKAPSA